MNFTMLNPTSLEPSALPNTTQSNAALLNNQTESLYCSYFTRSQCDKILLAKNISAPIAIVFCALAIVVVMLLSKYRNTAQLFAIFIVLSELISLGLTLNDPHNSTSKCPTVALFMQSFDMASLFFMANFTIFIAIRITRDLDTSNYAWLYVGIGWTIPCAFAVIPQAQDLYGPAGAWCWITDKEEGYLYRFILYWIPAMIITVAVFGVFLSLWIYVIKRVYYGQDSIAQQRRIENMRLSDYLRPFIIFAAVYVVGMMLQFTNRVNDLVNGPNHHLHIMAITCWSIDCMTMACVLIFMNDLHEYRPSNIFLATKGKFLALQDFINGERTDTEPVELPSAKSTLNRTTNASNGPEPSGLEEPSQQPEAMENSSDDFVVIGSPFDLDYLNSMDLDAISLSNTSEIYNHNDEVGGK